MGIYLCAQEDVNDVKEIRNCTMLGRPWGGVKFMTELSQKIGKKLVFKPKGRPTNRNK